MNGAGEMMVEARCVVRILLTKLVDYIKVSLNSPHPYFFSWDLLWESSDRACTTLPSSLMVEEGSMKRIASK
jgi:hypothetical protein